MTTISSIYGLRKELGLDDDTARDLYQREVGKRSLKVMTAAEQEKVADALRRAKQLAPAGGTKAKAAALTGPYAKKLQALWISGWNLGLVRNRKDEALLAFIEKQTRISHVRFLRDAADARKAVEALKSWLERAGVDWSHEDPQEAVLLAQGKLLGFDKVTPGAQAPAEMPRREAEALSAWWQWKLDGVMPGSMLVRLQQSLGALIRERQSDERAH